MALIVNNLGGTSNLELSVMANAAIRYLGEHQHGMIYAGIHDCVLNSHSIDVVDVCEFEVVRVYMGTLMTSLEMAGVSLTLLNNADTWLESLGIIMSNIS